MGTTPWIALNPKWRISQPWFETNSSKKWIDYKKTQIIIKPLRIFIGAVKEYLYLLPKAKITWSNSVRTWFVWKTGQQFWWVKNKINDFRVIYIFGNKVSSIIIISMEFEAMMKKVLVSGMGPCHRKCVAQDDRDYLTPY